MEILNRPTFAIRIVLTLVSISFVVQAKNLLHFGFVSADGLTAEELSPSLEIALALINNHSHVLAEHRLASIPWQTKCDRTFSLNGFFDHVLDNCNKTVMDEQATLLGVIGCGCTEATLPIAEIIHRWNIPLVSYSAGSQELFNYFMFPSYFQIHPSSTNLGRGLLAILSEFSWKRLAVFSDSSPRFVEAFIGISTVFNMTNSSIKLENFALDNVNRNSSYSNLTRDEHRIFFLNTYEETSRHLLCLAQQQSLLYPRYAWIIYGWYANNWWTTNDEEELAQCSNQQVQEFLNASRVIVLRSNIMPENGNEDVVGGITSFQFHKLYTDLRKEKKLPNVPESAIIYDSVWAFAFALNSTLYNQRNTSCEDKFSPENLDYTSLKFGSSMIATLNQTNFSGVSGEVSFGPYGIRSQSSVDVLQYRNGELLKFAKVEVDDNICNAYNLTYLGSESQSTVYPSVIPLDGTPLKVVKTFQVWLITLGYILAAVGYLISIICLLFNIIFKKRRIVRLTSPNLNYLIVMGVLLVYSTIFVYLIPTTSSDVYKIRCYVQSWTVTVGFTITLGTVMAKSFRVWHIFKNPSPNKRAVKDWHLVLIVACIVSTGIFLLLLRIAVPQFRVVPSLRIDSERQTGMNDLGVTEQYCVWRCIGSDPVAYYWQIVYFIYILFVLLVSLVLAFLTRKVKIDALNDSKSVSGSIYIGVPLIAVFFILTFVLSSYVHLSAAVYCIGLFLISTNFLALMFIPKMLALWRDPKGKNIFKEDSNFSAHTTIRERQNTMTLEVNIPVATPIVSKS